MTTTKINTDRTYTIASDPPQTFYLFSTQGDMKMGRHFLVDNSNHTLQYLPINSNIFNYANTYQPIQKYSYPPNTTNVANLVKQDLNAADCQALCNQTQGCSYYYSYKTHDGATNCIINNDDSNPRFLPSPANSTIRDSTLNIRDKVVDSSCNVNGYLPRYQASISSDQYMSFASYQTNMAAYNPTRDQEGACGDPTISKNLQIFNGKETFRAERIKEPYKERMFDGKLESFVPGYNANACQSLDSKQCVKELQDNINAINNYSATIKDTNNQINQNYQKLNDKINNQYTKLHNTVNNNPNYDAIDENGNLLSDKNSLLGAMVDDTKNRMLTQNNIYIFANLAAATALVAFLAMSPE
jgi:hypothetical protein